MADIQAVAGRGDAVTLLPLPRVDDLLHPTAARPESGARIEKAAKDFESILLGNWLQHAEDTFARVPGGEADDTDGDGAGQMQQSLAMQPLATALTAAGGIGIAAMIARQLHESQAGATRPGAGPQDNVRPP